MNEIKLSVKNENLETVLTILNSLKTGLLNEIQLDDRALKIKNKTQYQPKTNTIIREENSATADTSGKYMNPASYKKKLKR
ncbi:MAG: hypothetical protein H8E76_08540 [Helicobacteraceae bacterium]|nr:hypothetical protein [Candidatus Sulfurimonas ponti]MBL6973199.1 hypothetical protein [Sulfurimonas sp.]